MSQNLYKLYIDTPENFNAKIQIEGTNENSASCRLLIETKKHTLLFPGVINKDSISIPISKLKDVISEGDIGTMKLEVIADDCHFTPLVMEYVASLKRKVVAEVTSPVEDVKPQVGITIQLDESKMVKTNNFVIDLAGKLKNKGIGVSNLSESTTELKNIVDNMLESTTYNISPKDIPQYVKESLIYNDKKV